MYCRQTDHLNIYKRKTMEFAKEKYKLCLLYKVAVTCEDASELAQDINYKIQGS